VIDLDHNATTKPAAEVVAAMVAAMTDEAGAWHNPSSVHRAGQEARRRVELARASVAGLIGASPKGVMFCSGGTEAIDLAIRGWLGARRMAGGGAGASLVLSTKVEHSAVRELVERVDGDGEARVAWLPIDGDGVVTAEAEGVIAAAAGRAGSGGGVLISVQWANNETGVIQPVAWLATVARRHGARLHVDGTQWVGKMPTDVRELGADVLTFSAHKFGGPKGVGVLWRAGGAMLRPTFVGTQEGGRRGGTENVPGIAGCGVACDLARAWLADGEGMRRGALLRDRLEGEVVRRCAEVLGPGGVAVNGASARLGRLWNTSNIAFAGLEAEAILMALSERGVLASAGAACSSGSLEPSPVLRAMGVAERFAHGSVRFSIGRETTDGEIEAGVEKIVEAVRRVARSSR
jgi:cysteine desulfurase